MGERGFLSGSDADAVASALRAFWRDRGYEIEVHVEAVPLPNREIIFAGRCKLVRGLPPDSEVNPDNAKPAASAP